MQPFFLRVKPGSIFGPKGKVWFSEINFMDHILIFHLRVFYVVLGWICLWQVEVRCKHSTKSFWLDSWFALQYDVWAFSKWQWKLFLLLFLFSYSMLLASFCVSYSTLKVVPKNWSKEIGHVQQCSRNFRQKKCRRTLLVLITQASKRLVAIYIACHE